MLCYLKLSSGKIDDASLPNVNFISNKVSLVRKLGSWHSFKFKALKSWLPHKNAPKCRFWALAILNHVQNPQGRYWRYFVFGPRCVCVCQVSLRWFPCSCHPGPGNVLQVTASAAKKKEVGLVQPLAAGIKFPGVSGSWTGSYTVSMTIRHPMPPHATPFHKTHRHMMTHGQSRRQKMCPCAHLGWIQAGMVKQCSLSPTGLVLSMPQVCQQADTESTSTHIMPDLDTIARPW